MMEYTVNALLSKKRLVLPALVLGQSTTYIQSKRIEPVTLVPVVLAEGTLYTPDVEADVFERTGR